VAINNPPMRGVPLVESQIVNHYNPQFNEEVLGMMSAGPGYTGWMLANKNAPLLSSFVNLYKKVILWRPGSMNEHCLWG